MKKKCIVLFSGGLDSRLAVKIMQKNGFEVIALFFKLAFVKDNEKEVKEFIKKEKFKLKIFDCTKGKLLQEYLEVIKKAKHGTGAGVNPCIDCRIFILRKAKKFADEKGIEVISTGEVLGQRPMSQHKRGMEIVEKESGLDGRLFRPLVEQNIQGRRRDKQMVLAKKFKIKYPSPAGGCLLCEKELKKRLKFLLERGLNKEEIKLVGIGRHFLIEKKWIVLGRNKSENEVIENINTGKIIIPEFKGPSVVITPSHPTQKLHSPKPRDIDKKIINIKKSKVRNEVFSVNNVDNQAKRDKLTVKVHKLIKAYSTYGSLEDRKKFERFKL